MASLLEVGTGFHPELTGRENIYLNGAILGMKRAEIARKFDEIVEFAEVERFTAKSADGTEVDFRTKYGDVVKDHNLMWSFDMYHTSEHYRAIVDNGGVALAPGVIHVVTTALDGSAVARPRIDRQLRITRKPDSTKNSTNSR